MPRPLPAGCLAALALLLAGPAAAQPDGAATAARMEGRFVRALTALAIDDDSSAVRLLDEVLAAAPADATVLTLRAHAALRLGGAADAVYFARQAVEAAPGHAPAWLGLATALRAAGQPAEAAEALTRARRIAPSDLDVLTAAADLAAEQGDAAAERDALGALAQVGDSVAARLRLSALAERAGDAAEALAQAQAAADLAPSHPAAVRRLAELQGAPAPSAEAGSAPTSGAARFAAGRFAEAAEALLAEVDADPRRVEAWALALRALAATADPRAGATADDALLFFASVPSVLAAAAEAYAAAGRADDAAATARRGLDALALVGDGLPDAPALRSRLDAVLAR